MASQAAYSPTSARAMARDAAPSASTICTAAAIVTGSVLRGGATRMKAELRVGRRNELGLDLRQLRHPHAEFDTVRLCHRFAQAKVNGEVTHLRCAQRPVERAERLRQSRRERGEPLAGTRLDQPAADEQVHASPRFVEPCRATQPFRITRG